ncbi:MAG: hypothetical protein AAF570_27295, partial [Bacteroidota bacterium]
KLDQEALLGKYLAGFPENGIRLRHLLEESSGLPDHRNWYFDVWEGKTQLQARDVAEVMEKYDLPLRFAPGSRRESSPANTALLAQVLSTYHNASPTMVLRTHYLPRLSVPSPLVADRLVTIPKAVRGAQFGATQPNAVSSFLPPDSFPNAKTRIGYNGLPRLACTAEETFRLYRFLRGQQMQALTSDTIITFDSEGFRLEIIPLSTRDRTLIVHQNRRSPWLDQRWASRFLTLLLEGGSRFVPRPSLADTLSQLMLREGPDDLASKATELQISSAYYADPAEFAAVAQVWRKANQHDRAVAMLKIATALPEATADHFAALGKSLVRLDHQEAARKAYEEAVARAPKHFKAQQALRAFDYSYRSGKKFSKKALMEDFEIFWSALEGNHPG